MKDIVSRMLMLGLVGEVDEGRDIANGDVYGVGFTNGVSRIWFKGDVNVAAPWIYRNPVHE